MNICLRPCFLLLEIFAFFMAVHADEYFLDGEAIQLYYRASGSEEITAISVNSAFEFSDAPILEFAVAQNGAVALVTRATNLVAGVKSWSGPQVYIREPGGAWNLLTRDGNDGSACGGFYPLVFLDIDGDGIDELIFEAGPTFSRNGSISPELRGYAGPIVFTRSTNHFSPLFQDPSGLLPSVQLLRTNSGESLLRSNAAEAASLAGQPADGADRWYRIDALDNFSFLTDASAAGEGYTFWRNYLAGFSVEQLDDVLVSGPAANPDGDDLPNILEAATGGDPLLRDGPALLLQFSYSGLHVLVRQPEAMTAAPLMTTDDLLRPWSRVLPTHATTRPLERNGHRWLEWVFSITGTDAFFYRLSSP